MTNDEKAVVFDFVRRIIKLGESFNFSISSWRRTPQHNTDVGSKYPNTSRHLKWLAVDTVLDKDQDVNAYYNKIKEVGLHFLNEGSHIHVQMGAGNV